MSTVDVDLKSLGDAYGKAAGLFQRRVVICAGTGCMANGAMKVFHALEEEAALHGISLAIELDYEEQRTQDGLLTKSGCQGFCQMGPLLSVEPDGILYCKVRPSDVAEIVRETLLDGKPVERLLYQDPGTGNSCRGRNEIPFYALQQRTVLKSCGSLDPENLHEYLHLRQARRRLPHRTDMGDGAHPDRTQEIHRLQWRRRGSGGLHGPLGDGRQPPRGAGRHDDRRPGHRRG